MSGTLGRIPLSCVQISMRKSTPPVYTLQLASSTSSYRLFMLLVVFCINDPVPADMEVAEERSPAMTDSSEGEVDQRIIFIEMMILVMLIIWVIDESGEGE